MLKKSQFLLFPLLTKQGKPVIYNDDIHCTYIYYSKHGTSDVEHFEMTAQNEVPPSVYSKEG